jgi:hypothetical protein
LAQAIGRLFESGKTAVPLSQEQDCSAGERREILPWVFWGRAGSSASRRALQRRQIIAILVAAPILARELPKRGIFNCRIHLSESA